MNEIFDVIIIGGGASGLMCASYLFYLNPNARILILERNEKIGTKLYITGNGRCNLSNTSIQYVDYCTDNHDRLNTILSAFPVDMTLEYFENNLGIHLQYRDDLVYPFSNKSSTVVDAFKMNLKSRVEISYNSLVKSTRKVNELFEVNTNSASYKSRNIVFAGGGRAAPKTGSDGNIYRLILPYCDRSDFTQVNPSLVQFKTLDSDAHKLAGTRVKAEVTLYSGNEDIASSSGELMFTDYGLSGICIFDLSAYYYYSINEGKKNICLKANLLPGENALEQLNSKVALFPERSIKEVLSGYFTRELSELIVSRSNGTVDSVASNISSLKFAVSGTLGFDNAQVTSGGVNLGSVDDNCMLSSGVYVIGETVNVDGPCGGYNLQWAWSSAMAAAKNISERME